MTWKAVARSSAGTSHQKQQIPCQDYGAYKILNNVIVAAVADGAGSAKHSEIGAKLAVKTVIRYLAGIEEWLQKRKGFWQLPPEPLSEELARKIFTKTIEKVLAVLQKQAANHGYAVNDLACTLLILIATPNWIAAMQIGDGFIVMRSQANNDQHQLLFLPDKGEFINETTFVTSASALAEMRVCVKTTPQAFICASTDGLEPVAVRMSDWTAFTPFFQPLEAYLRETCEPEHEDEYLMNFLNSDRLNARTSDDKTLLLCLFE